MTADAPRPGDVLVLIGTKKGLFLLWSDEARREWRRALHHEGWMIHDTAVDPRDGRLYVAANSEVFGAVVQRSDDLGASWAGEVEGLDFSGDSEFRVRKVWQLVPGEAPGVVYAGTERAGLFRSEDGGHHWSGVDALNHHPHAETWMPGGGGLCLHTIVPDQTNPDRTWVALSTGGVYQTDDGGRSWAPTNRGIAAGFLPEEDPEYGQCVHKLAWNPAAPERLYAQNHGGVYRSDDGGVRWTSIAEGLPSDFGFPIAVHPHDPDTVYVVPLEADVRRFVPDGRMAVWRSRDAGASWEAMDDGMPENAYLVILRDALALDACDTPGVYVGTTTGQVFYSRDEGDTWDVLADYLPPVYSVVAGRVPA